MQILMEPIGFTSTKADKVPRHWTVSDLEGKLIINEKYLDGLRDIKAGQKIVVIFCFDKSPKFTPDLVCQTPAHKQKTMGVFSICSPRRPNPIGLSVLNILDICENVISVKGIDMYDGTPILDIKPYIR